MDQFTGKSDEAYLASYAAAYPVPERKPIKQALPKLDENHGKLI